MDGRLNLKTYLQDYLPLYIFVSVLFLIGVTFGAILVNALTLEQKQDLTSFLGSFLHSAYQGQDTSGFALLKQSFGTNLKWLMFIWVLGLSIIGLPLIYILNFLKGVLIGFTVGYMVSELSWKGVLFSLIAVAPQNIIMIPMLIIASVLATSYSLQMMRNRLGKKSKGQIRWTFKSYSVLMVGLVFVALTIALFESYISPAIIAWAAPFILAFS